MELDSKNAEIADLRGKLESLQHEKESITESFQSLRRDIDEIRNTATIEAEKYEQKITSLKKTIKEMEFTNRNEMEATVNRMGALNEENIGLVREIKRIKEESRGSQENAIRLEERLAIQIEQNEKLRDEIDQLVIQKERLFEASAEANAQIVTLKQKEEEVIKLQLKEQDYLAKVTDSIIKSHLIID